MAAAAWAHPYESHGRPHHISITLPPLAVVRLQLRS
jgi:hypothetical protein